MRSRNHVLVEIRRHAAAGRPLNSGANRGDWLYAGAVTFFGSWGKAVEAAGFCYDQVKLRCLSRAEVLRRLRVLVESGEPVLATEHPQLRQAASNHFGSWKEALAAAGADPKNGWKWTTQTVAAAIRRDIEQRLPVNSLAMVRRNEGLYAAGRRRFGSWAAAVEAARRAPCTGS
jgi:hypothetical protein